MTMGNNLILAQTEPPDQNFDQDRNKLAARLDTSHILAQLQTEQSFRVQQRPEPSTMELAEECFHSAIYSGFQAPIKSLGQVADDLVDESGKQTTIADALSVLPEPAHEQAGTARGNAQLFGSAVGLIAPFLATRGALKSAGLSFAARAEAATVEVGRFVVPSRSALIADSAITGFASEFLLRPTVTNDSLRERTINGVTGAATFATLTAAGMATRSFARPMVDQVTTLKGRVAADIITGTASGVPAGIVNADVRSLVSEGRFATPKERLDGATSMAIFGGLMNAAPRVIGFNRTVRAIETASVDTANFNSATQAARSQNLRSISETWRFPRSAEVRPTSALQDALSNKPKIDPALLEKLKPRSH